jgi:MFS family permease
VALGKEVRTATREEPNGSVLSPMLEGSPDAPPALPATPLPPGEEPTAASLRDVLRNRHFRFLWIAQICSQLAQNLTWIILGAFVRQQTKQTTLVAVIIVSAMLAQLFLSGFAGVLVDRASKRAVLFNSNVLRVILTLLFIATTPLDVAVQATSIIILIFIANAVAQFFMPAEAATIPLVVEKRNLIAATSLFNITVNACQVIPVTIGLLFFTLVGIVPVLLFVAALYVVAAALVFMLPPQTAVASHASLAGSLREAARHVVGDVREALHFLARDPGLRLTIFQINVAPTFLFVFGTLGFGFVEQTFGLRADRAWILLLPAGVGLVAGALVMGQVTARFRKEAVIHVGLLAMGVAVAVLGAVAVIVLTINRAAGDVRHFIEHHIHALPPGPHNLGLIPAAMVISLVIGLAIAMSTIPAQTLVLERTSPDLRGRVLSMQQLIGGAIPIIPLLTIAPLADLFGDTTVMTAVGLVILLVGVLSVYMDRSHRASGDAQG